MKATTTWILIADGARARVFLNDGPGKGLKPAIPEELSADLPKTREVISDRPGSKSGPGAGTSHGFAPREDWQQFEKRRFAGGIAKMLNAAARRNAYDRLVLVAPPEPLGALRSKLDSATRGRIIKEIGKDLTGVPPHALPKRLTSDDLVL